MLAFHLHSIWMSLLGFFYFKLFYLYSRCKKANMFQDFTPWTPIMAQPWTYWGAYNTSRSPLAFCNIQRPSLCSKTDISKTAWINACLFKLSGTVFRKYLKGNILVSEPKLRAKMFKKCSLLHHDIFSSENLYIFIFHIFLLTTNAEKSDRKKYFKNP